MKYDKLAKDIIDNVGGEENIESVTHCVTRLRFKLKDEDQAKTDTLKNMDGVLTVLQSGGQYQVVIGNQVGNVYEALIANSNINADGVVEATAAETASDEARASKNEGSFATGLIDLISSVFQPVLGVLAAMGVVKGLTAMLVVLGVLQQGDGAYIIINAIGDALFYFFPIFLGQSAMKKFGGSPIVGGVLGAILVYPGIVAATQGTPLYTLFEGTVFSSPIYITFFGLPVILTSYATSVIPIVMATAVAAPVERFFKNTLPDAINNMMTPFFTLALVAPLALLLIGPIATWIGAIIGTAILAVYNLSPAAAGLLLGGIWQVLVIFGLHWGIVPISFINFTNLGYDPILVLVFGSVFAQIGAVLGVVIKTKDKRLKTNGMAAFFTGFFGITEPAIYGITLPRKKTFIYSCVGSALAGGIVGFFGTVGYEFPGLLNIFSLPTFINPQTGIDMSFYGAVIGMGVAFISGLVLTLVGTKQTDIDPVPIEVKEEVTEHTVESPVMK